MTADQVRKLLDAACREAGGQKAWSRGKQVSPSYVGDILSGRREPGEAVCKALGLERVVSYKKADVRVG